MTLNTVFGRNSEAAKYGVAVSVKRISGLHSETLRSLTTAIFKGHREYKTGF